MFHCPGMLFVVIYLVEKGETAFFSPERKEQAPAKKQKKKSPRKERTKLIYILQS